LGTLLLLLNQTINSYRQAALPHTKARGTPSRTQAAEIPGSVQQGQGQASHHLHLNSIYHMKS